ncbi:MAG: polysaccharide deacetylase family protein [Bacteroidia bacterium]
MGSENCIRSKKPLPALFRGVFLVCSVILFLNACEKEKKPSEVKVPGKLVLVCDDWNVDNWYSFLDSFEKYDIVLTFYVSHFHTMSPEQKAKLLDLQSRGHEIAYHTLHHIPWDTAYTQIEMDAYLRVEIDSGVALLRNEGFVINCFAFPGEVYDSAIFQHLRDRFAHVRTSHFGYFEYWLRRREFSLMPDKDQPFRSYALDNASLFAMDGNGEMILEDLKAGTNVAVLFHSLTYENHQYTTNPADFFGLIKGVHDAGVHFSTVSGFYR